MRRTPFAIVAAGLAFLGCGSDSGGSARPVVIAGTTETADSPATTQVPIQGSADSAFPSETLSDVVTYADQVSEFIVVAERAGEPEGEEEPYTPRFVTVRILDNLWEGPRFDDPQNPVGVTPGSEVEFVTWGSVGSGDGKSPRVLSPFGEPRLEVGQRYVGAFFVGEDPSQGTQLGTYPAAVVLLNDDGTLATEGNSVLVRGASDASIGALADRLATTEISDAAKEFAAADPGFMLLDPLERVFVVYRGGAEPTEVPTATSTPTT